MIKVKYIYPVVWLGLMVIASLTPSDQLPDLKLFKHADKAIHWAMYFGFSIFLIPLFLKGKKYKTSYFITLIFALLCGVLMEYLQIHLSHGRSAEFGDVIANGVGVLTGILFYARCIKNKKLEKFVFKIG